MRMNLRDFELLRLILVITSLVVSLQSTLFAYDSLLPTETSEYFENETIADDVCERSEKYSREIPDDYKAHLYFGHCVLLKGDIDGAMAAFDRADILNEKSCLTHKSIAGLQAKIGNFNIAKKEYEKAESFCKKSVIREPMDSKQPNHFSSLLQVSRGNDDNVKQIANIRDLNEWFGINNYPIQKESDRFTKAYLQVDHTYHRDLNSNISYKSQIFLKNINHDKLFDYDYLLVMAQTGPAWSDENSNFWIPLEYREVSIGSKGFSRTYSLKPDWYKTFDNNIHMGISARYEYTKYLQWDEGNHYQYSGQISFKKSFSKHDLQVGYRYLNARKKTQSSPLLYIDNYYNESSLHYTNKVYQNFDFLVGFFYRHAYYKDTISDLASRYDILVQVDTSIAYKATEDLVIVVRYYYFDNKTNYVPSNYSKNIVSFGITYSIEKGI